MIVLGKMSEIDTSVKYLIIPFYLILSIIFGEAARHKIEKHRAIIFRRQVDSRWATIDEIKETAKKIDLKNEVVEGAGIPIIVEGEGNKEIFVDDSESHTLIIGSTGSGKTRRIIMPLLNILTLNNESMIITDPKGELLEQVGGLMKEKGYKVISLSLEGNVNLKPLIKLTNELMEEVNQKRENKGMLKRKTRILIVGIPNVGKSTLINRLVGKKAVNVGNKPGVTKNLDWIRINDNMELLDSPGILWPKLDEKKVAFNLASLTAIKEEILPLYDVCEYIINTLYQYYPEILKQRFGIENIDEDFVTTLELIGKKRGCLIRGGEIDYDKVINIIMNEIKSGIIRNITFDRFID